MAARIAIIAITTSSSISVNALRVAKVPPRGNLYSLQANFEYYIPKDKGVQGGKNGVLAFPPNFGRDYRVATKKELEEPCDSIEIPKTSRRGIFKLHHF